MNIQALDGELLTNKRHRTLRILDNLFKFLIMMSTRPRHRFASNKCPESITMPNFSNHYHRGIEPHSTVDSSSQPVNLFPSVVIPGEGAIAAASTTQFVSDANLVSATKTLPVPVDPAFIKSSTDMTSQEIRDFLSKPVIVASGNFATTDTFGSFSEFLAPNDILNVSSLMSDKLKGYFGFRATVVLRLVVNANRFQQGRYNLQMIPLGGGSLSATGNARNRVSAVQSTLVQRSQLPHVEIDLACDTEAVLKVPYNAATNFFPLRSLTSAQTYGSVGLFRIYPYVALVAPVGSTTCGYTLWGSFEDIELIGAAVPQSGRGFTTSTRSRQARNETDSEQATSGMGPISSSLMRVKNAADIFTKVPLLSSYASMTSWYSELLAGAASAFGWSRPINLEHSVRVTQNYLPYAANADGPDQSFPLSYSYKNQVGKADGFSGTDVDEMDFSFLCTIPTYNSTLSWTTSTAIGALVATIQVRPLYLLVSRTVTARTIIDAAPYQLIANMFDLWRGSMVYKFKLVKTEFHSGRLAVSFAPNDNANGGPTSHSLAESAFLHRQIIDIRECNEFTFVVPFISSAPFRNSGESIGILNVHVLDQLVAPSTVSTSVSLILESCMGADAEFAVPRRNTMDYVMGIAPQSNMENTETNVCANYRGTIGISNVPPDECVNSLFCVGERISSFRTLIKLPNPLVYRAAPTASLYFNIVPYFLPYTYYNSGTPAYTDAPVFSDVYTLIASLYVYNRGGIRLKFLDNTGVVAAEPFAIYLGTGMSVPLATNGVEFSTIDGSGAATTNQRNGLPTHYYKAGFSGEVQIPSYNRYHSRLTTDALVNGASATYSVNNNSTSPDIYVSRTTVPAVATLTGLLRAASDDANFGVFLAVPPITGF